LQNSVKSGSEFDRYASSYDKLLNDPLRNRFASDPIHFHRRKWILIERLLKRAGVDPQALRWLDVGCGRGELLGLAGSKFAQAVGCDPCVGMLASNVPFKGYEQPSPVELPFEDHSFDFVTVVCVLHHVRGNDQMTLTNEIRRVLSPGGLCCVIEHNPRNPVTRAIVKRCPVDQDAELLNAHQASKLLEASGFTLFSEDYFLYLPEALFHFFSDAERVLSILPFGGQYALVAHAVS
jgi:ubiquinone/menaquinone biosynthesis C-methylase UbiE